MRSAGNFNPEWGYLAPAPGFMRTLRIVLVAVTVGAIAGAATVFSLVGRSATDELVAARTLVRPAEAGAGPLGTPVVSAPATAESSPATTTQHPAGIAALAESPRLAEGASARICEAAVGPREASIRAIKKHHYYGWWRDGRGREQAARGPLALRPSARAPTYLGANWSRDTNWPREED